MPAKRTVGFIIWLAYCALQTLQLVRFYSVSTIFYLNMPKYLAGHERLPFQERVLPILFLKPLFQSNWIMHHLAHTNGIFTAERGPFYLLSLLSFVVAGIFVQKLYGAITHHGTLRFLVYPVFLCVAMWSYVIHSEANFSYPYDFPAVAFFAAGLYLIYTRKFLPLLLVMFLGTLNRETTLFLIGIYILDAASTPASDSTRLRDRFAPSQVSWSRVALLAFVWLVVKLTLAHIFAHNDPSENFVRVATNFGRLKLRLWPALLNICGYLVPIVWIFRRYLAPVRFANYLYILPFWFAIMFYTGVILETRIYGELSSFVAVAVVLIGERYIAKLNHQVADRGANPEVLIPEHLAA